MERWNGVATVSPSGQQSTGSAADVSESIAKLTAIADVDFVYCFKKFSIKIGVI